MGKGVSQTDLEADELNVEDQEVSTHQETAPLPWFCGRRLVAIRWISAATGMVTIPAKEPGAKK